MRQTRLSRDFDAGDFSARSISPHAVITPDPIEEVQLSRLAGAVLSKSPADLAALAEANPMLVWEWIEAFRRQKVEAEAEVRYWSAAMAALSTTATRFATRAAAE